MQLAFSKGRELLIIVVLLLALLLYNVFFIEAFGRDIKLILISLMVFVVLIFLLTGSRFRTFLMFIVTLPLTATLVVDIGFTVKPAYWLLLLLLFAMLASREFWYSKSPLDTAVFVFLGVCSLSIIQTVLAPPPPVEFTGAMKYRGTWFRSLIQISLLYFFSLSYFFTVHLCGSSKKRLDTALKVYISVAVVITIYAIYQGFATHFNLPLKDVTNAMRTSGIGFGGQFIYRKFDTYRSQATFGEPLGFGYYLLSVLPFLLTFGSMTKGFIDLGMRKWISKHVLTMLIILFVVALFMARARGPLLSFIVCIVTLLLLLRRRYRPRYLCYLLVCLCVLTLFFFAATKYMGLSKDVLRVLRFRPRKAEEDVWQIVQDFGGDRFRAITVRTPLIFFRHPILGVGIGNSSLHFAAIYGAGRTLVGVSGLWANLLVDTGILGLMAFGFIVFSYYRIMIRTLMRVRGTYWAPYIIGYIACFTALTFGAQISSDIKMNMYNWFLIGMAMATVRLINRDIQQAIAINEAKDDNASD